MADLKITNLTKSPYIIPQVSDKPSMMATMIMPGDNDVINEDVHTALLKGNQAYQSMIEQRLLVVTKNDKDVQGVLKDASTPVPPQDLSDELETSSGKPVVVDKTVEVVTVDVDNGPAQVVRK